MITFAQEQPAAVFDEIKPLLHLHWREIAHFQDIELNPQYEFYLRSPVVRVFTARDGADLVGYAVFCVGPNKHYQQSLQAAQDIFYVHPDKRTGRTGYRFIRYCDDRLRAEGVQAVYHHTKRAHDFGNLLEAIGYEAVDIIYARRLDKE